MEANMAQQKQEQSGQPEEDYRHGRRHHHGGISGIGAGVFLLLLGVLLFLANQGILGWDKWWQFLIIGIGIILLVDSLIRYQKDSARGVRIGRLITAIILIGVGIAFLVGNATWWPLIIILVGVVIIVSGLFRRGQSKS
jgi:asparagine N-glycosylation enzyme membrane subunit Stt3